MKHSHNAGFPVWIGANVKKAKFQLQFDGSFLVCCSKTVEMFITKNTVMILSLNISQNSVYIELNQ